MACRAQTNLPFSLTQSRNAWSSNVFEEQNCCLLGARWPVEVSMVMAMTINWMRHGSLLSCPLLGAVCRRSFPLVAVVVVVAVVAVAVVMPSHRKDTIGDRPRRYPSRFLQRVLAFRLHWLLVSALLPSDLAA